ncbi:MAG: N-acetylmuramoyl-L-alanine amidase [Candidatus Omnitrophota bacterium]|nr:N-acetylmuramoyl-L-alanine amidase [Candidatus Omnitrophota bacterium]
MQSYLKHKIAVVFVLALFVAGCAAQAPYLKLDQSLNKDMRVFNDVQYVPLLRLCEAYGIDWKWDSFMRTAIITKNGRIILRAGSDRIIINENEKKLSSPVVLTNGIVYVPTSFVRNDLGFIVTARAQETAVKTPIAKSIGRYAIRTIVLDAGHGGKDPGAIGRRLRIKERDITLAIAKKLRNILEDNGIKVIMTRDSDVFIPLQGRARLANSSGADLFVSVHVNASRSRSLNGFECYYLSEATDDNARAIEAFENATLKLDEETILEHSTTLDKTLWDMKLTENRRESAELASYICRSVENSLITRNRGTKTARFYVLKYTRIPSVLVETGYISNKFEELKFRDPGYADRMAEVIAKGVLSYKNEYERTEGFTL